MLSTHTHTHTPNMHTSHALHTHIHYMDIPHTPSAFANTHRPTARIHHMHTKHMHRPSANTLHAHTSYVHNHTHHM